MKKVIIIIILSTIFVNAFSQGSKVSDVKMSFLDKNQVLLVKYNVDGITPLNGVNISIKTPFDTIIPITLSGDFGDSIMPGKNKTIKWNCAQDNISLNSASFDILVCSDNGNPLCTTTNKVSTRPQHDHYLMLLLLGAKYGSIGNWGWYASCQYSPDNYDFSVSITVGVSKKIVSKNPSNAFHLYAGAGFEFEMATICFDWGFMYRHKSLMFNLGMGVSDFDEFYPTLGVGWIIK